MKINKTKVMSEEQEKTLFHNRTDMASVALEAILSLGMITLSVAVGNVFFKWLIEWCINA